MDVQHCITYIVIERSDTYEIKDVHLSYFTSRASLFVHHKEGSKEARRKQEGSKEGS
tara:strand:+ start:1275 stop:1445 length:171 start_codon:yes stop_codon:yes gene_type:complete